jgi:hypothetical protein
MFSLSAEVCTLKLGLGENPTPTLLSLNTACQLFKPNENMLS